MINYMAILGCGVLAMIIGFIWYGPLFGKTWMRVTGAAVMNDTERKQMQKNAIPLYVVQFLITLIELYVLANLIGRNPIVGLKIAVLMWLGFVMPTLVGMSMWTNEPRKTARTKLLVQAGFQLVCFVVFGFILATWH